MTASIHGGRNKNHSESTKSNTVIIRRRALEEDDTVSGDSAFWLDIWGSGSTTYDLFSLKGRYSADQKKKKEDVTQTSVMSRRLRQVHQPPLRFLPYWLLRSACSLQEFNFYRAEWIIEETTMKFMKFVDWAFLLYWEGGIPIHRLRLQITSCATWFNSLLGNWSKLLFKTMLKN